MKCLSIFGWAIATAASAATLPKALPPEVAAAPLPAERIAALKSGARAGHADAQLELAFAYDEGSVEQIDRKKAARWYERAAENGVPVAHLRLGQMLEEGSAEHQSYAEAREHYEQAISGGVTEANLRLGILYLEGWGVPRDASAAIAAIEKAAAAGYQPAQLVLSDMYAVGIGVTANTTKAVEWAQKAAGQKSPGGEYRLGSLAFRQGLIRKDFQLAREWYQLSAEQTYTDAMMGMAATFLQPGQTRSDRDLGIRWLCLAAENGNRAAAFYLAGYFLWGEPRPDESQARQWLTSSSEGGEAVATEVLELVENGWSLRDAFRHVVSVPFAHRYVQRFDEAKARASLDPNGTNQPLPTKLVMPVYPAALELTHTEGDVLVDFIVDTTGRVRNAHAIQSTHQAFNERAVEAVRQWVFLPGRKAGLLVPTHMQVPVFFRFSAVQDAAQAGPKDQR